MDIVPREERNGKRKRGEGRMGKTIFYSDDQPFYDVSFQIPAEKWEEFTSSKEYGEMKKYVDEMQRADRRVYYRGEYDAVIRDVFHRIYAVRSLARWALAISVIAIAAAAVALLR